MKWTPIEGSVLTCDLCSIFGCDQCPGHIRVRDLPVQGRLYANGDTPPDPDATVLCSHSSHRGSKHEMAEEDMESGGPSVTVTCPRCKAVQTLPAFAAEVDQFFCPGCGQRVKVGEGPVQ
jgi:hypothetical protein